MKPFPSAWAGQIDTPAVVIDLDIAQANIARMQARCDAAAVRFRPHIKTHKSAVVASMQRDAGGSGVTCQKLGEAEVLADAGERDILISYNVFGAAKHARLRDLAQRVRLTVCCDSRVVAEGYAQAMQGQSQPLHVLVECDTGRHRCGVTDPAAAAQLARVVDQLPGLAFEGLLMYPPDGPLQPSIAFVNALRADLAQDGLALRTVSSGGTPNQQQVGQLGETEYRAGTYVYNDRQMVRMGAATFADCALLVYATVVSAPEPGRVMLDAGSKTLSSDLAGFHEFGLLVDHPQARIYKLAEEHGFVNVEDCARAPVVGDVVRILPNHACVVSNLCGQVLTLRHGQPAGNMRIDARGRVA